MRPTWRAAGALTLWLILGWYATSSEVSWLFLLAAWVLALMVASAAYAVWNRAGLRLELAVEASRPGPRSPLHDLPEQMLRTSPYRAPVFETDPLELTVRLRTAGGARGPAWAVGTAGDRQVRVSTGVVPSAGWTRIEVILHVRRGPVGATGWSVGSSDPLGFFRGERNSADTEVALVLPRFASLAKRRRVRELEAATAAPRAGSGNELFGIREYRPGDSLRRIHWRSSARHGDLVVREYEPPGLQTLTILVDPSPPSVEAADQIARLAASEAWNCISDGGRVVISAPGLQPSGSPRDMWSQLEWLARYPNCPSGPAGRLPANGEEVVVITATNNPDLIDAAVMRRRRWIWVVGDADIGPEVEFERVGTQWPL